MNMCIDVYYILALDGQYVDPTAYWINKHPDMWFLVSRQEKKYGTFQKCNTPNQTSSSSLIKRSVSRFFFKKLKEGNECLFDWATSVKAE